MKPTTAGALALGIVGALAVATALMPRQPTSTRTCESAADALYTSCWPKNTVQPIEPTGTPSDPVPGNDPNEAYELISSPTHLGLPADWWTVNYNGAPVMHFSAGKKHLAERYVRDSAFRQEKATPPKLLEKGKE